MTVLIDTAPALNGSDSTDILTNVETFRFADGEGQLNELCTLVVVGVKLSNNVGPPVHS